MKKRRFLTSLILSFLLAGFAACSFGGTEEKSVNAEFAYLSLTVNGVSASARDIFPTAGTELLKTLSLTGKRNGGASQTITTAETLADLLSQSIAVETGTWEFTLTAKINEASYSATVQNVTVSKEGTNSVSFELKADSSSETQYGAFSLKLALVGGYENVTKVTATVQTPAGETVCAEEELSLTEDESNVKNTVLYAKGVTDADEKLAVGTYRLIVTFYGGDTGKTADGSLLLLNTYREFVHIASGIVTTATRTVDLNEVYTITWYDFDESGAVTEADAGIFTGNAPTQFSRRSSAIALPGAAKEDWIFDGWYTDEACTDGNEISQIAQNTTESLRLYPKWTEPYARVGTEYYRTYSEAVTAITEATGDVAVKLYSMVTGNEIGKYNLSGTIGYAVRFSSADSIALDMGRMQVKTLQSNAFYGCEKIGSVILPETLTEIPAYTFYGATQLQSITIPSSVMTIGISAFRSTAITSAEFKDMDTAYRWKLANGATVRYVTGLDSANNAKELKEYTNLNCTWTKTSVSEIPLQLKKGTDIWSVLCNSLGAKTTATSFQQSETPPEETAACYLDVGECHVPVWLSGTTIYYYSKDYTDGEKKKLPIGDPSKMFNNCSTLETIDVSGFDTSEATSMASMFYGCSALTSIDGLSGLNASAVKTMTYMFYSCRSLVTVDVTGLDTSSVTDMSSMFYGCSALTAIDGLKGLSTSSVTSMTSMFSDCRSFVTIDLTGLDTSSVKSMDYMFSRCTELTAVDGLTGLSTSAVTTMVGMFRGCTSLTTIDLTGLDTSHVESMAGMFSMSGSLTSVDVTGLNTSALKNMGSMFSECSKLTSVVGLTGLNTSSVTSMASMFANCSSLTSIDLTGLNTSSVTTMESMFSGCSALTSIDLTGLNTSSVTSMTGMFSGCSALTAIDGLKGLSTSSVTSMTSMFSGCSALTSIAMAGLNAPALTTMSNMFMDCMELVSADLSGCITPSLSTMTRMFSECSKLTSVNVAGLNTSSVTNMSYMFNNCSSLKTIIASDSFDTAKVTSSASMFSNCHSLVGGAGTAYDSNHRDKEYARIDGGTDAPGYFTASTNASTSVSITFAGDIAIAKETAADGTVTLTASDGFTGYTWEATPAITGATASTDGKTYTFASSALETGFAYSIMLTATRNGIPYSTVITVVSEATAALSASPADQIAALTASGTIVVTGAITGTDITSIASALKAKATENANIKVSLDLSGTTGLTAIGNEAFQSCTALESIVLPDGLTRIKDGAFAGSALESIEIPASIKSIGTQTFWQCSKLKTVVLHEGLEEIGTYAFAYCSALESIKIPGSVVSINQYAFSECRALATVVISEGVKTILYSAFEKCESLESLTIPASVTSIGERAFQDCSSLKSITLSDGLTRLENYTFMFCTVLESIEIPASVKSIGFQTFWKCLELKTVVLPDGLESIGRESFGDCYALKSIEIPASVTSIGKEAFSSTELTSVTFSVTTGWTAGSTALSASDLADTAKAAAYLKTNYASYDWARE